MASRHQKEPTANRVPKGDGSTTLKMSVGKKVLANKDHQGGLARIMYGVIIINGAQYCRPHLLERCHLCQVDHRTVNEETNEERQRLGLRPCGDHALNERSTKWGNLTTSKILEHKLEVERLVNTYGRDHAQTHPEHWREFMRKAAASEREINDEFLADDPEVSQCCYWACENPNTSELRTCSGCAIVKYCCKEHQAQDWSWEHKGECRLPEFLKQEYEEDRKRNLAGNYEKRDHDGIMSGYP